MQDIKPIETVYNGYRFRSRLEARWAVFFDALGVKYEYEPEGFLTEDGTTYLPDFFVRDWNCYVEVKGDRDGATAELIKAVRFVDKSINRVLILSDIPDGIGEPYWFPMLFYDVLSDGVNAFWVAIAREDYETLLFTDFHTSRKSSPVYHLEDPTVLAKLGHELFKYRKNSEMNWESWEPDYQDPITHDYRPHPETATLFEYVYELTEEDASFLQKCYEKARQARFEHGETPKL